LNPTLPFTLGNPITQILPSIAVPTVRRETVNPWGEVQVEHVPLTDPSVAAGDGGVAADGSGGSEAGDDDIGASLTVINEVGLAEDGGGGDGGAGAASAAAEGGSYYEPADGSPPQDSRLGRPPVSDADAGLDAAAGVVPDTAVPPVAPDVRLRYPTGNFPGARPYSSLASCAGGDYVNSPERVLAAGGRLASLRAFASPKTGCIEALHQTYRAAGLERPVVLKAGSDGPMVRH
jgi:hypothetical protein